MDAFKTNDPYKIKSILIHTAALNDFKIGTASEYVGVGVIPISIKDIINKKNNEICFTFGGNTNEKTKIFEKIPLISDEGKNRFSCVLTVLQNTGNIDYSYGVEYMRDTIETKLS
jgi:hypothetical protein